MDPITGTTPTQPSAPTMPAPQAERSTGALIAIALILAILIGGGLYLWQKEAQAPTQDQMMEETAGTTETQDEDLEVDLYGEYNADMTSLEGEFNN